MRGKPVESFADLGSLQREIVHLVWANAPVSAEKIRSLLKKPLKESTVRTVLRRLEDKDYITHTIDGRTFIYHMAQSRGRVAATAVQRIVDWVCHGSVEEVVLGMVDSKMINWKQLRKLADKFAPRKPGR